MNEDNLHNDEYIEIDLKEYLYILWKNKLLIITIVLISILLSYIYSVAMITPSYESKATLLTPNFELVNNDSFNSSDYINLLKNNEIGNKIKNEFYDGEEANSITIENIHNKLVINSNNNNRNINLILKDNNPNRAQNMLDYWINEFKNNVNNDIDNINNRYLTNYENRLNEQYKKYTNTLNNYTKFKQENNLNLLKSQLSKKEYRLVDLEIEILNIKNRISNNESELTIVNKQLNNTDKFYVQKEKISDESLRKLNSINPNSELVNLLSTENEILNPQYNSLINKKNNLEQSLISLETKYQDYLVEIEKLEPEIKNLQMKVNNLEEEKTIINNELNNLNETYNNILLKYNEIKDKLIENEKDIIILNNASNPNTPSNRNIKLNLAISFVLGLFLAVFIVFIKEFLKGTNWSKYKNK